MPTLVEAIKAARTFRETQPAINALKDTVAANKAARETLGEYMAPRHLTLFRGVELKVVPFSGWDMDALKRYLGSKASRFRKPVDRKYFDLAKRARRAKAPTGDEHP
jgi:hypothetical protein